MRARGCGRQIQLTVLRLRTEDDVALDGDLLQARARGAQELAEAEGADAAGPEALEGLGVLAPGLEEDVEAGAAVDVDAFEELQDGVTLVGDEEGEGDDEALDACQY